MTRRNLIAATAAAAAGMRAAEPAQRSLFEVRTIRLRNGTENQRQRAVAFLQTYSSSIKQAGAGPVAAFSCSLGEDTPYLFLMTSFKGYADMEACQAKLLANSEYTQARTNWYGNTPPYERVEIRLLRGFPGFPVMTPPPTEGRTRPRIFELRTYELENFTHLERKVRMFDEGETAIFVRAKMLPVFFGETVVGPDMPSLMYMLGFDDMAARESCWREAGGDPAWKTLGAKYSDVATVPNLSFAFLSPLAFSDVR